MVPWWVSQVECASAVNRSHRERTAEAGSLCQSLDQRRAFTARRIAVRPLQRVRNRAVRPLRSSQLRSADALQLAAALVASGEDPRSPDFDCSDSRLSDAASREGFAVV